MAGKCKIRLLAPSKVQGTTGEVVGEPVLFREVWATRTESGGRDNIYASRIVHENEVILTIRQIDGITPDMLVEFDGIRRPISGVVPEGFRKWLHIKVTLSDLDYVNGY